MADNLKGLLRLWRLYARMDLMWLTQDLTSALLVVVSEALSSLSAMAGVLLLAMRFGGVGGLTADEVLFMLGFFALANGLCWMFFGNYNVIHISRRLGRGQLDHMLIQPRPLWMQLLTEGFMPFSGCHEFLIGLALTCIALRRLELRLTPAWLGLLAFHIVIHAALRLAQSALYGAMAFWQPVACEEISTMILDLGTQLGRFPLFGLPRWLLAALHTVLPIGLLGYLPALALLRQLDHTVAFTLPLAVACAFATAAVVCFRKGLKHYETYSCPRYSRMGFRN